jgi:hypothetical protein
MDNSDEIKQKITELQAILSQYKNKFGSLENELNQVISEYRKALEKQKISDLKKKLNLNG